MDLFDSVDLWRIDAVSILLLVLVVGIAAAVVPYAHRSLRGDRRGREVTVAIVAMLLATAVVSVAGALWLLAIAWSASTIATIAALGLGGGRPAILRAIPWLLLADLALWSAVVLAALAAPIDIVAVLLVLAALVRCAAPPAHGWLVDSLHAPTPVSAALHGGVVNGGGILVITQIATIGQSSLAVIALAVGAAVAIVVGVVASLVRTDVKGRLVMSTVAQMGFMLLIAALGLVAAALLHLVAHGFYKSALFLSSSDGIDRRAADRRAPRSTRLSSRARYLRLVAGAVVPTSALVVTAMLAYPGARGLAELVVLIVLAVAFGVAGARATVLMPGTACAALAAAGTAVAAVTFALFTSLLTGVLSAALEPAGGAVVEELPTSLIVVAVAFLVMVMMLVVAALRAWAPASPAALAMLAWAHSIGSPMPRRPASSTSPGAHSRITADAPRRHDTMGAST